jgi:hypothetical protein
VKLAALHTQEEAVMTVAVIQDFKGATLDQYDEVLAQGMGLVPRGPAVAGCLFHWVTPTDEGFRVTDVWESREIFQKAAAEKIGPGGAAFGLTPPEVTFVEIHNYLTAG